MDEDMNSVFEKLNTILNDESMSENLKDIFNNFSSSSSNSNDNNSNKSREENKSSFDFDINTILKIKKIMDSMNLKENDSRTQLLLSLKPYLSTDKKEKLDNYMKLLKMAKIFELLGGDSFDKSIFK